MHMAFYASIRSAKDVMGSQYPQSQKSQGFKSGDVGGQAVGKLPADNFFITKMAAEQLFHATGDNVAEHHPA